MEYLSKSVVDVQFLVFTYMLLLLLWSNEDRISIDIG